MGEELNYRQSLCKLGKEEIDLGNLLATEKDPRNGAHLRWTRDQKAGQLMAINFVQNDHITRPLGVDEFSNALGSPVNDLLDFSL